MNGKAQDRRGGLERALAALRSEYTEEPPAQLEALLRARVQPRKRAVRMWGVLIAAAALALFGVLFTARHRRPAAAATRVVTAARHELRASAAPEPAVAHPAPTAARHPHRGFNRSRPRPAEPAQKEADGFLAIPYAEPLAPSEQIDVYRVQLPRVTLAHYGLPAAGLSTDSPVIADVAVGSDGVVRAVRFVH